MVIVYIDTSSACEANNYYVERKIITNVIRINVGAKGLTFWKDDEWYFYLPYHRTKDIRIYEDSNSK